MLYVNFGLNWPYGNEEKDFWMSMNIFLAIDRPGPSFEQTWIPIIEECFVPSLDEIGPVVWENMIFKCFRNYFTNLL